MGAKQHPIGPVFLPKAGAKIHLPKTRTKRFGKFFSFRGKICGIDWVKRGSKTMDTPYYIYDNKHYSCGNARLYSWRYGLINEPTSDEGNLGVDGWYPLSRTLDEDMRSLGFRIILQPCRAFRALESWKSTLEKKLFNFSKKLFNFSSIYLGQF